MALLVSLKDKIRSEFLDSRIGSDIASAFRQVEVWAGSLEKYLTNSIGVVPPGVMGPPPGSQDVPIGAQLATGRLVSTATCVAPVVLLTFDTPVFLNHVYAVNVWCLVRQNNQPGWGIVYITNNDPAPSPPNYSSNLARALSDTSIEAGGERVGCYAGFYYPSATISSLQWQVFGQSNTSGTGNMTVSANDCMVTITRVA